MRLCGACCYHTYRNAKLAVMYTRMYCAFGSECGNSFARTDRVKLLRCTTRIGLTVVATAAIDEGEIIGEYLGKLRLVSKDWLARHRNRGYVLLMNAVPDNAGGSRVCIDAE